MRKIIYVDETLSDKINGILKDIKNPSSSPAQPLNAELWQWIKEFLHTGQIEYNEHRTLLHALVLIQELWPYLQSKKTSPPDLAETLALAKYYIDDIQKVVSFFVIKGDNDTARKFNEVRTLLNDVFHGVQSSYSIQTFPQLDVRKKDLPSLSARTEEPVLEEESVAKPPKKEMKKLEKARPAEQRVESKRNLILMIIIVLVVIVAAGVYLYKRSRPNLPPPVPTNAFSSISVIQSVESRPPYIYLIVKDEWFALSKEEKEKVIKKCAILAQKYRYPMLLFITKKRKPLVRFISGRPLKWFEQN